MNKTNSDKKRLAVITGGTRGLGRSLCFEFAHAGYDVTVTYHADATAAHRLEAELGELGKKVRCLKLDAGERPPDWDRSTPWDEIALVNNAIAPFIPKPLHLLDWEDFEQQLKVTVKGSFLALQSLYRFSKPAPRRTVVNVLSEAVLAPSLRGALPYIMAKQALLHLSQTWAAEQMKPGLRIFCVSPGFMDTTLTQSWPETLRDGLIKKHSEGPDAAARKIRELVEDSSIVGEGENYDLR